MTDRYLLITIDTEVDKGPGWRIADPVSFRSVLHGVPDVLSPMFDEFGAIPTYLLSPEVIDDEPCAEILAGLGGRAELGSHLHAQFVEPQRTLGPETMAGQSADALQCEYPCDVEAAKLTHLTDLFENRFGRRPTSFRAGRYGLGPTTLEALARLGYVVDSSVTPGLRWSYPQATLDYRDCPRRPSWIQTAAGEILEVPLAIRAGGWAAAWAQRLPAPVARGTRLMLGARARHYWLRPTWEEAAGLIRYIEATDDPLMVLMFHSVEIVPGASPYAASQPECDRIVAALRGLLAYCDHTGISFCGLSDAVALV